ncbi:MAG: hypothetical protein HC904_14260 [Blastochloris sp.]|nr:hypothetical protein [Blastochloris sp.]
MRPGPIRPWAWQMYSRHNFEPNLILVDPLGNRGQVELDDYFGSIRKDLDYRPLLLKHLQEHLPPGLVLEDQGVTMQPKSSDGGSDEISY